MEELVVKKFLEIDASAADVWDALTNPEKTKKYMFGSEVESDWKVGSTILWKGVVEGKEVVHLKGVIEEVEPGRMVRYSCFWPGSGDEDEPSNYTHVTYELSERDGRTLLTVSQGDFSKFTDGVIRFNHTIESWDAVFLALQELLEGR
jgi:uncharacterized protein YndB with AHSA1/START domain